MGELPIDNNNILNYLIYEKILLNKDNILFL